MSASDNFDRAVKPFYTYAPNAEDTKTPQCYRLTAAPTDQDGNKQWRVDVMSYAGLEESDSVDAGPVHKWVNNDNVETRILNRFEVMRDIAPFAGDMSGQLTTYLGTAKDPAIRSSVSTAQILAA